MEFLKKTMAKKNWLFSLGLVAIFFLIFPQPVFGGVWDSLLGVVTGIPYLLIGIELAFFILVTQGIAIFAGSLLNVVTSPGFISLSYTNPATNNVIKIGLEITQSFVSMALVIVLIFVALSITLRWKETTAKKTFVNLIIVALLVNFAPVVCGLIVDASNIVMNYFLVGIEKGVGGILSQAVDFGSALIWEKLGNLISLKGQMALLTQGVIQIILNLAVTLAFLFFAVIFLLRYIAIWILVILSPLAFVAWILPATKKFWTLWWNQLIQWSIIGIPLAFFLYLGMRVFEVLAGTTTGHLAGIDPILTGYFDRVFPYFVVLGFLFIGFVMGLKTSAMGSAAVIRGFQAAQKTARSRTLAGIGRAAIAATGVPAATRGFRTGFKEAKGWKKLTGGFKGAGKELVATATPSRWTKRAKEAIEGEKKAYRAWRPEEKPEEKIKREWGTEEKPGTRGFVNAFRDIAGTGWKAAVKPPKKKGTRKLTPKEKEKEEVEIPEEE